jgi:hypothetical protein
MRVAVLVVVGCVAVGAQARPLRVSVAAGTLAPSLVHDMCAEAGAIWSGVGLSIVWRGGDAPAGDADVRVVFDEPPTSDRRPLMLGWVLFSADRPDATIHLSVDNTRQLLAESTGVIAEMKVWQREALTARGLGRALAHELGHVLLESKGHTARGLMRAQRTGAELFEPTRLPFAIDAGTRAAAATSVAALAARR